MPAFFDLQKELTTNREFGLKSQGLMQQIVLAEKSGNRDNIREATCNLLSHCRWNPGLLVPYYFPSYPKNKPMTLWSRPHAFAMMATGSNITLTVQASRQVGKCLLFYSTIKVRNNSDTEEVTTIGELFEEAKKNANLQ